MRICVAADHAGFALKERVREFLAEMGHEVEDLGTHSRRHLGPGRSQCADRPRWTRMEADGRSYRRVRVRTLSRNPCARSKIGSATTIR
jgi:hypothetical protein